MTPRYIVYNQANGVVRFFNLLAEALDFKGLYGGIVYEPLGMSTAEKVAKDPDIEWMINNPD